MAKADRGFASMHPDEHRRIASKGGKAAHAKGVAHTWTTAEAQIAGRLGGLASQRRRMQTNPAEHTEASGTMDTGGLK